MTTSMIAATTRATDGAGRDHHGNPMSGTADAIALYDRAMDRLLRFDPVAVDLAGELVEQEPQAAMAHVLVAYLHLMSTDVPDLDNARAAMLRWPACRPTRGRRCTRRSSRRGSMAIGPVPLADSMTSCKGGRPIYWP